MPTHSHSGSTNSAGNHSHNIQCNGWDGSSNTVSSWQSNRWQLTAHTDAAGNHTHTISIGNAGSSQSHNNMQPYISCYIWKRTA